MHIADTLPRAPRTTSDRHPMEQHKFSVLMVSFVPTNRLRRFAEHTTADKNFATADHCHKERMAQQTV